MHYLLHIETATPVCSVALSSGNKILAIREKAEENSHASLLTVFIEQLFKETGIRPSQLNAVSVSAGPGSYTGLRIGVSTAKGLCYALNIPLISVSTLKAMANGFLIKNNPAGDNFILCPAIDARRMEIYYALYNPELNEIKAPASEVVTEKFLIGLGDKEILIFGTAWEKVKQIQFSENPVIDEGNYNSSAFLVPLANEKFINNKLEDVAYFEPFYLKDFYTSKSPVT